MIIAKKQEATVNNRFRPYLEKNGLFKKRVDANQWILKFKGIFSALLCDDKVHPVSDKYSSVKYLLSNDLLELMDLLDKLNKASCFDKMTFLQSLNYYCHKIKNKYQFATTDKYIKTIIQRDIRLLNKQVTDILAREDATQDMLNCLSC